MALVSISEASKLTGKSRTTIHRHIDTGKLSRVQDETGGYKLDTSELLRVYGSFKNIAAGHNNNAPPEQNITQIEQNKNINEQLLKTENDLLKKQIELLQDHVSSLKQALVLLEHKKEQIMSQKSIEQPEKEPPEVIENTQENPKRKKFLGLF